MGKGAGDGERGALTLEDAGTPPTFNAMASAYNRMRPKDANWRQLTSTLIEQGDLAGRRVLELGCGTGTFAGLLGEHGARVTAVDAAEKMVEQARVNAPAAQVMHAPAERLPFADGEFERLSASLVLHLVDRDRALPELARVLAPGGRMVATTFAPEAFDDYWLNPFFPSYRGIEAARFPQLERLRGELEAAGFAAVRFTPLAQQELVPRDTALERIRNKYFSTLRMLPDAEFNAGLAMAEERFGAQVRIPTAFQILTATRR